MTKRNVAILIFKDVEVLDFSGPFEIFNAANEILGEKLFNVFLVSENSGTVSARNGFNVIPDFNFGICPEQHILIIPGGPGRKIQMNNTVVINWIKSQFDHLEFLLSVCTGAFIIGKTGLLKGLKATTHHASFDEFQKTFPETELIRKTEYVDNGKIITSGGISTGMKASLMLLDKISGDYLGKKTAEYMEYDY